MVKEELEKELKKAEKEGNAVRYREIHDKLGTPYPQIRDIELYDEGVDMMLEKAAKEKYLDDLADRENVPELWGLRKADLGKLDYGSLEDVFYGLHNLAISVEMLDVENPDEILSQYLAAGFLKRQNRHKQMNVAGILGLVRDMNEESYSRGDFRVMANNCKRRFKSRTQADRLHSLSIGDATVFVDSFLRDYRPSDREEPSNYNAFHDPNLGGANKRAYVNAIYKFLEGKWQKK